MFVIRMIILAKIQVNMIEHVEMQSKSVEMHCVRGICFRRASGKVIPGARGTTPGLVTAGSDFSCDQ